MDQWPTFHDVFVAFRAGDTRKLDCYLVLVRGKHVPGWRRAEWRELPDLILACLGELYRRRSA